MLYLHALLLIMIAASTSYAQQVVAYPSWLSDIDTLSHEGYLPPEYTGAHPTEAKLQIATTLPPASSTHASLRGSAISGVVGVSDRRSGTPSLIGWDTGLNRVYSILRIGKRSATPARFICTGWDSIVGVSKVVEIRVAPGVPISQTQIGPSSPGGAIWSHADFVDDKIYMYDLQTHCVRRMTDTDADDIPDQLDATFSVAVPQDLLDPVGSAAIPIRGFRKIADGVVRIKTLSGTVGAVRVVPTVGGHELVYDAPPPPLPTVKLENRLVRDQKRVVVFGTAGTEFVVVRKNPTPNAPDIPISKKWTVASNRRIVVDLKQSLHHSWLIRLQPSDPSVRTDSWIGIDDSDLAVLFRRPRTEKMNQGEKVILRGDKFRANHTVWYQNEHSSGPLATIYRSAHEIIVRLPIIGSNSATPPFSRFMITGIALKNAMTGELAAKSIPVFLYYD